MKQIVDLQMEEIRQRLAENNIGITLEDDARTWLASIGYDPAFGARPLRRALQKYIESPVSMKYLSGEIKANDKITVRKKADAEDLEIIKQEA